MLLPLLVILLVVCVSEIQLSCNCEDFFLSQPLAIFQFHFFFVNQLNRYKFNIVL